MKYTHSLLIKYKMKPVLMSIHTIDLVVALTKEYPSLNGMYEAPLHIPNVTKG